MPEVPGAADPTQVLPSNAGSYDPDGATSVLPHSGGPGAGQADPTAVLPPVPPRPDSDPRPEDPHPWQSQLRAARDRNEQTQVQYLDPSEDPLRRRPQRRQQPPQQPRDAQQYQQPQQQYQQRPQRQQQYQPQPQQQQYQPQRQQYQPQPQQQAYAPPQQPQQPQQPAQRAPREPRRSSNPMKIPGLGCLKGCLFTLVLLFVASWLIWELTPLKDWIGTGQSYWHAITDAFSTVKDWMSKLGSGN